MLYIDSNPEKQEQNTKTHEERSNKCNKKLFVDISCVLCRCYFITVDNVKVMNKTQTKVYNTSLMNE